MELQVLLWILAGGFGGTWGLCIFFMIRTDNAMQEMRKEIREEITALHLCIKDHHSRLSVLENNNK